VAYVLYGNQAKWYNEINDKLGEKLKEQYAKTG
jgi:hypothetical protein